MIEPTIEHKAVSATTDAGKRFEVCQECLTRWPCRLSAEGRERQRQLWLRAWRMAEESQELRRLKHEGRSDGNV